MRKGGLLNSCYYKELIMGKPWGKRRLFLNCYTVNGPKHLLSISAASPKHVRVLFDCHSSDIRERFEKYPGKHR